MKKTIYREFYKKIKQLQDQNYLLNGEHKVTNKYTDTEDKIIELIQELEQKRNKQHDNLRYRFLPKIMDFNDVIISVVLTHNRKFINLSDRTDEIREFINKINKSNKNKYLIGYWTTLYRANFYNTQQKNCGQYSVPKKGVIISQDTEIQTIKKQQHVRQQRSDTLYNDLKLIDYVEIDAKNYALYKYND